MSKLKDGNNAEIDVILPKAGILCQEEIFDFILCKPKLMPLKSLTLEKLEKMQKEAEQRLKEAQEAQEQLTEFEKAQNN